MKAVILFITCLFGSLSISHAYTVEKLTTGNFCLLVDHYKGAYHYPDGMRYKIGMYPEIENNPEWHYWDFGMIEGVKTNSTNFSIQAIDRVKGVAGVESLVVRFVHKRLPLHVSVVFSAYGETGVITSSVKLENKSDLYPIRFTEVPSINIDLSSSDYEYAYLTCSWSNERKLQTKAIEEDTFFIQSTSGRSSTDYSPWLSIHDKEKNIYYNAQLAWSGNWYMQLYKEQGQLKARMGEFFDNNQLTLLPRQTVELAEVAISGGYHSMDAAANNLHRYQRHYLLKRQPANDPMLMQFNTWFPSQIDITAESLMPYIDAAADLVLEAFVIDAGWYVKKSFEREVGRWTTNPEKFPHTLRETADYVRSKGMKFGIWFELESLGEDTEIYNQHPDWCLQYNGQPVISQPWGNRKHLDYHNPEVFDWALSQFRKVYDECGGLDWVKLDYNISIGSQFQNREGVSTGDCLRNHILAYYRWLDVLSETYPNLVIENCSSGALRMDIGMMKHVHTSFVSDETSVNPSLGMAWSSTLEYTPRMINHWMVGMGNHIPLVDQSLPAGYWDYMFRVPMNGQFGISSRILDWSPELIARAKANIALYKKIRTVIADADCYHLTPQPDYNDPQGWTVLAYVSENAENAVVMANRGRDGDGFFNIRLPQLKPSGKYRIEIDGKAISDSPTGARLAKEGLRIQLEHYRTAVISFQERR